MAKGQNK